MTDRETRWYRVAVDVRMARDIDLTDPDQRAAVLDAAIVKLVSRAENVHVEPADPIEVPA